MEVKNKKRKAGKIAGGEKIHKNNKPAVKKMKIKKSFDDDSKPSNGLVSNKLNGKKNFKKLGKNVKVKKEFDSEDSKIVEKNTTNVTTKEKPNKIMKEESELKSKIKKKTTDQQLKKKITQKVKNVERRKEVRKEFGQYKPENIDLNEEELTKRIEKISSREKLSKTARRKLSVFKKKLSILQGTYIPKPPPAPSNLSKTERRKLRRQKLQQSQATENQENGDKVDNENMDIQTKAKQAAEAVKGLKVKRQDNVITKEKQKKQEVIKNKKIKINAENIKKEVEEDDGSEESDEDDEDDEDNDETITINIKKEAEEDDEDEESDDNNEEDEESDNEVEQKKEIKKVIKVENGGKLNKVAPALRPNEKSEKKKRYVLFVGNLPFTTTREDIKNHFLTKVSQVTDVRIPLSQETGMSRGMAYVEFNNSIDFEKGLSLHQTQIKNRKINVCYSTADAKKDGRSDIIAKNKKLQALRKRGKLAGSVKETQKRSARRNKQKNKSG